MRPGPLLAALAIAGLLGGCASGAGPSDDALGLIGPATPEALKPVLAEPYAPPAPRACAEVDRQIAELDALLGPDVDAMAGSGEDRMQTLAKGAVRGLIPYRSVARFLTGAAERERDMALAVLAGAARRGYLKGVRESLSCPPP